MSPHLVTPPWRTSPSSSPHLGHYLPSLRYCPCGHHRYHRAQQPSYFPGGTYVAVQDLGTTTKHGVQYIPAVPMSSYLTTSRSRVSVALYPHFTREQAESCFPRHPPSSSIEQLLLSHAAAIDLSPGGHSEDPVQFYLAHRIERRVLPRHPS